MHVDRRGVVYGATFRARSVVSTALLEHVHGLTPVAGP